MKQLSKFQVLPWLALSSCLFACDADEVAQGAAQQRVELSKPATKPAVPTEVTPKVELKDDETPEQRIRRLKNEGTRDNCLETLKTALRASSYDYNESQCTLKFKRSSGEYIWGNLNNADATVRGRSLAFSCRDPDRKSGCVGSDSPVQSSRTGWQVETDADGAELQRCLDFLHERCKEM